MKFVLPILMLTLSTSLFAAELTIHTSNKITFKKIDKNVFEKINEVSKVSTILKTTIGTSANDKKYVNDDKMILKAGDGIVRIQDESAGIDKDVPATIEKSFLIGNIKSITIKGENLEDAYYETLEKQGFVSLANLDLQKNNRKSLTLSNQVCTVEKDSPLLICNYDLDLKVENNGVVLGAAIISLQLGAVQN